MASVVSIIVEICDEKMANMWRKTEKNIRFVVLCFVFLSSVLVVVKS